MKDWATRPECSDPRLAQPKGEPGAPGISPIKSPRTGGFVLTMFGMKPRMITGREFTDQAQRSDSLKVMKPPATDTWLLALVMAVLWAIVTTISWALLALGFGHSRGNLRLMIMLIICAVVVAFLCAHAYREGWKSRHNDGGRSSL